MLPRRRALALTGLTALAALAPACEDDPPARGGASAAIGAAGPHAPASSAGATPSAAASAAAPGGSAAASAAAPGGSAAASAAVPAGSAAASAAAPGASAPGRPPGAAASGRLAAAPPRLIIDEPNDAGPAAPMAATERGVVFVSRAGELSWAALTLPLAGGPKPHRTALTAARLTPAQVVALGRGPSLTARHAYWVAGQRLQRGALEGGAPETLAPALDGTRAAAAEVGGRAVVAFIAKEGEESVARVWREGRGVIDLSPLGSGATAVDLVDTPAGLAAVTLDARMAMTQLHLRPLGKDGEPGEDAVVWSGGPAQPLTEVVAVGSAAGTWAYVAMEQDATHFALAELTLPAAEGEAREAWRPYANGLDPAPVAAARLCGAPFVAVVRPESAAPGASQLVELAAIPGGAPLSVAAARAVNDLSLAAVPGGGLLAWVADKRTWAVTLRCATPG